MGDGAGNVKLDDRRYSKELEEDVFRQWEESDAYRRVKEKKGDKKFFLMDGPPYATGNIHMGHAWNKTLKDVYIRYYRMNGYDVFDKPGWDTHGTPIEVKVEKELGITSKREIMERVGVAEFVKRCEAFATQYINAMTEQFKNIGVWMDWDDPYITLSKEYIEAAWWTFKRAWERGLLYKGKYPVHVCPRCSTVLSFAEVEYKEMEDPSIYVKFPVEERTFLLVWTTTPWTLPANVAVMAHPREKYVTVEVDGEKYILAEERLEHVAEELGWEKYEVVRTYHGKDLEGMVYEPVLDVPCQKGVEHKVVLSERFVSMEEGTGLVHVAPGHGREDFLVGEEYGLPVISPLTMEGVFTEEAGRYAGMFAKDADAVIIKDLEEKGLLAKAGRVRHSYPICWRCKSPLLFMAVDEWFYKVTAIQDKMEEEARKVKWQPAWAADRFVDWVKNLRDWPVSRQRFWGIPVPIWECECGHFEVIGSFDELKERGAEVPEDVHRPWVDGITFPCPKCGKTMKRTEDVLDVWFDSGITTWAALGYPRNKETFENYWPADLEIEGVDQVRGWWNSQMITSVIVFDRAPYKNIIMHGLVLDVHGIKMSKSLGNVIAPEDVIEKYTRDVLRAYLITRPLGPDIRFDWEEVKEYYGFLNTYWNLYKLVARYVVQNGVPSGAPSAVEDRWIVSRLNTTVRRVREHMEERRHDRALEEIRNFVVEDFSRKYVKIVRDRAKEEDAENVYATMMTVMDALVRLTAPFVPFISEKIYSLLFGRQPTVFLEEFPVAGKTDEKLEENMEKTFEVAEEILALRHEVGIKLRWPVREVVVSEDLGECAGVLARLVNAKKVTTASTPPDGYAVREYEGGFVAVPSTLTEEERKEALAREVLRRVQEERKAKGLMEKDRVVLYVGGDDEVLGAVKSHEEMFNRRAGADRIVYEEKEGKEYNIDGKRVVIALEVL